MKIETGKFLKNTVVIHIILWICLIFLLSIPLDPSVSISIFLPIIPAVYLHYFFLEVYFKKGKYIYYGLFTLATILIFGVIAENILKPEFNPVEIWNIEKPDDYSVYYRQLYYIAGYNPLIGIVVSTFIRYLFEKKEQQITQLQLEKKQAELDALKKQLNPHFFFNTLNSFYSMAAVRENEELAESIMELSELMRYVIYDTGEEFISLEKEVEHLKNYINLQKLRYSDEDNFNIQFTYKGEMKGVEIPPMLLIPFVENAFKYGYSVNNQTEILIDLYVEGESINFKVFNQINIRRSNDKKNSGVGLENVRKRLELLYPEKYSLSINESEEHFDIVMKLPVVNENT